MPLDTASLVASVQEWAENTFRGAVDDMLNALDDVVPRSELGSRGDGISLAESRRVNEYAPTLYEIAYEAEHASYTDEGTRPHPIVGNPLLAFVWEGRLVIVHSVQHPGTKGTRWWTNTMTDHRWGQALETAAGRTALR